MQSFSQVRGVERVGLGMTVVLDGGSNELRYFDEAGALVATVGGSGDGPGEFRHATSIIDKRADSLVIFDQFAARLSVFTPNGVFARSLSLGEAYGVSLGWLAVGSSPDGRWVLRGTVSQPPPPGGGPESVLAPLLLATPESETLDPFSMVPSAVLATDGQGRSRPVFPSPILSGPVVSEAGVWVLIPMRAELSLVGWSGARERLVRFAEAGRALEVEEIDRIAAWHRALLAGVPEAARARVGEAAILPRLPDFANLIVDDGGHVWVQEVRDAPDPDDWQFGAPAGGSRWRIIDNEGVWLTTVEVDPQFRPYSVEGDLIAGVWTSTLEEEQVRVYRFLRN